MSNGNGAQRPKVSLAPVKALANLPVEAEARAASPAENKPANVKVAAKGKPAMAKAASPSSKAAAPKPKKQDVIKAISTKPAQQPATAEAAPVAAVASARVAQSKPAPAKAEPAPATSAPVTPSPAKAAPVSAAPAPSQIAVPVVVKPSPAKPAPAAAVARLMPGAVALPAMGEEMLKKQASAARQLGKVQALALDHAVSEFKAGMGEIEELAKASSLSEALLIQARAFRRGQEAWVAHWGRLAQLTGPQQG